MADTLDALLTGVGGAPLAARDALAALETRADSELDPSVVEVALPVLDKLLSARDT